MNCVIVGYGRVGNRTVQVLDTEGHEVTVVENVPEKVERARDAGLSVIEGDGANREVLETADLERADAIGGLTGDPEVNFEICSIGNDHGCRTVLRVSEEFSEETYQQYSEGVDELVYPEQLGAAGAKTALLGGDLSVLADVTEHLSATVLVVPDGSPVIGERVVALDVPDDATVYAHGRADEDMTIPLPKTAIETGDRLAVMAEPAAVTTVRDRVRGSDE